MLDKIASWDKIDFSSSLDAEIATMLKELNICLLYTSDAADED